MTKSLALIEFTQEPDGSVTVACDPAPRCDRCRHWDPDNEDTEREYRRCFQICAAGQRVEWFARPADFGCVLFEAKEEAKR